MDYHLYTHLTTKECIERLESHLAHKSRYLLKPNTTRPMYGNIDGHDFSIQKRQRAVNPLAPVFRGQLIEHETGGTVIKGRTGADDKGLVVAIAFLALAAIELVTTRASPLGLLLTLAFVASTIWFGRWAARDCEAEIVGFLETTLQAEIVNNELHEGAKYAGTSTGKSKGRQSHAIRSSRPQAASKKLRSNGARR